MIPASGTPLISLVMSLVQVVVVRTDLDWPQGAVAAQGIHASVAALHKNKDCVVVSEYLTDTANMTTRVYGGSEAKLERFCSQCEQNGVVFERWVEMPENLVSAAATIPISRKQANIVSKGLDRL